MGRAPCCEKEGLKKGRWTAEEDEILVKYIQRNGEGSWRSLPKKAGLLRCGKSCRLRWINYLREDIKRGNISSEEEDVIIKLHGSFGNRWSLIAGYLPGRTDNEIKNYWNSHLSRRIHSFTKLNKDGVPMPMVMDVGRMVSECKRRGGRTRRSAMKKNLINLVEMSREKQHGKCVPPTLFLQLGNKENKPLIPSQNEVRESIIFGSSEKRQEVGFGPQVGLDSRTLSCPNEGMESHVGLAPNEEGESGVLDSNEGKEDRNSCTNDGIFEDEFFCLGEGIDSPNESESGAIKEKGFEVMDASDEKRESDWCSSLVSWFDDDVGCLQEWERNDLEDKMREDGEGERWQWSSSSEVNWDYLSMDDFGPWFLSIDIDVL